MKPPSLRLRLILMFVVLATLSWLIASLLAWKQTRHNINELFDTQQMVFAKRLVMLNPGVSVHEPQPVEKEKNLEIHHSGEQDDDALAFAIFNRDGQMVMNDGDKGSDFIFDYHHNGFTDGYIRGNDDPWRIVWLTTADNKYIVAVGQEWDYRQDMSLDIILVQLIPWLVVLVLMVLCMIWLITRELSPLRHITSQLSHRLPDDDTPLATGNIPKEVYPMIEALNGLFARIGSMLARERRFTSDAAHELRSPLAALKVQTEVVQLANDDVQARDHALLNLNASIERAARVVDQLLTLSRLDSLSELDELQNISWDTLLQSSIADMYHKARAENVELGLDVLQQPLAYRGHQLLLAILARNLIDNAVRYSNRSSTVTITLEENSFSVADNGPGVSEEFIHRISERFFRPPGQDKTGTGLGLSIVERIAQLHNLTATFNNLPQGGFIAKITWH